MKLLPVILAALWSTGCASNKLPMPSGSSVQINSLAATEQLMHDAGYVIVGPERDSERVRNHFMYNQPRKLQREPNPEQLARIGADLVNRVVTVRFDYASDKFKPDGGQALHLMQLLSIADRVEIRGRTDAPVGNDSNVNIAYRRADAARRYLLNRGVPGSIMSINVVGAGDHIADNHSQSGRAQNRRVEIEFYIDIDGVQS